MFKQAFDRMRNFQRSERGAITVEFVVTLPILLAVLAFVQQYGEVMRIRNAMDIAVRDAARFIARAPVDENTGLSPDQFVCRARGIIEDRMAIFGAGTITTTADGISPWGCTGLYTDDGTGAVATNDDGSIIVDTVSIIATEDLVVVAASYQVRLTFARLFATRQQDVEWTVEGVEGATFTARTDLPDQVEDLDKFIMMTATEVWPRYD